MQRHCSQWPPLRGKMHTAACMCTSKPLPGTLQQTCQCTHKQKLPGSSLEQPHPSLPHQGLLTPNPQYHLNTLCCPHMHTTQRAVSLPSALPLTAATCTGAPPPKATHPTHPSCQHLPPHSLPHPHSPPLHCCCRPCLLLVLLLGRWLLAVLLLCWLAPPAATHSAAQHSVKHRVKHQHSKRTDGEQQL